MNKSSIVHETDRLIFKNFTEEDMTDEYFSWFYDKDVTAHNSHGLFPYTDKQKKEFLESIDNKERIVFAVYSKFYWSRTSKQFYKYDNKDNYVRIGNVDLTSFDWINRSAELSIVIGNKDFWGKGCGKEMCNFVLEHAFNKLNLNRVWTGTTETNQGMRKLAEKIGMYFEGSYKQGKFLNGKYVDICSYGIVFDDWKDKGAMSPAAKAGKTLREALGNLKEKGSKDVEQDKTLDDTNLVLDDVLDQIEKHRGSNNKLWMKLAKIATKTEEGLTILREIKDNDAKINKLMEDVCI